MTFRSGLNSLSAKKIEIETQRKKKISVADRKLAGTRTDSDHGGGDVRSNNTEVISTLRPLYWEILRYFIFSNNEANYGIYQQ